MLVSVLTLLVHTPHTLEVVCPAPAGQGIVEASPAPPSADDFAVAKS
jgi:hypothetical protein